MPTSRYLRQYHYSAHKHCPYPTQYTLIVLGPSSASPDPEQSAYRLATNGDFNSAPVCPVTLFYFELLAYHSPLNVQGMWLCMC